MILGEAQQNATMDGVQASALDDLFRRAAVRRPDAVALIDPPNRARFTDGPVRQLTYIEADRVIWAIAARLRKLGLTTDAIVAVQLANTVESVLALLGILRAGMIAAPLPMLWREREAVTALNKIGAKALIGCSRIGATDHGNLALRVAAQVFPIRHVCGFGAALPDGITTLDDLYTETTPEALPVIERSVSPAAHLAAITFDVEADGLVAAARSHAQLVAGGLAVFLESRIAQDATILSALPLSSFAGLSLALVPWLMSGGTLALHQPFDPDIFDETRQLYGCEVAIVPGALVQPLADAGHIDKLAHVIALWRTPERLASAPAWLGAAKVTDVQVFGETGLLAARRDAKGLPAVTSLGSVHVPRGAPAWLRVAEVSRSASGTLALRGPMMAAHSFPPDNEREDAAKDGFVDTGYACRSVHEKVVVTGGPTGLTTIGGYRLAQRDIEALVKGIDPEAVLAAVPDALSGHRLGGSASNPAAMSERLTALGVNPLVASAFRARNAA
ncbi:MAG TPA: class I adenylate-forming enzyme family protein [Pseudolabrys sp.]|nr:class I adenylate-forming enzyme family protein [Pseudolabrys sp.]